MKDDVEMPAKVPRKRRELERALDQWLAVWAADDRLPAADRRRVQEEREHRKRLRRLEHPEIVGVLLGEEGATPQQVEFIRELVHGVQVAAVLAPAPLKLGLKPGVFALHKPPGMRPMERLKSIVRVSTTLVAAPKEAEKPQVVQGVWEAVRYAKHRDTPVRVVMPDGKERR